MAYGPATYRASQLAMRFVLWAEQLRAPPRVEDVMVRFEVCRATAFRLIGNWRDAKGLPRSAHHLHTPDAGEKRRRSLRAYHASRRST